MIHIGTNEENNLKVQMNLENLIGTRLLIQANSGGGKSWLIRRLLEQSHGKVQQIVIDLEGEFSTLREKYDYLLVGSGGEIPANIKTAELLARKLLELNVSTIIDLSELKHHERILFVKRFLDSLIAVPKKLWHPCLVIVDEAHQFCPQTSKSDSASSVIDLMTRGRKRGFCGILATQRISKLHKDACAEANNRLIGRTGLDIDRKRASEELGFTKKEDEISLRHLKAGEFYAFGSSISEEIVKVRVGDVKTTHPEAGKGELIKSSATPENIKKLLKDVIDLPKEAEAELKTTNDYKSKVMELKREVRILESSKPKQIIDKDVLEKIELKGYNNGLKAVEKELKSVIKEFENKEQIYHKKLKQINQLSNYDTESKLLDKPHSTIAKKAEITPEINGINEIRDIPKAHISPIKQDYDGDYNLNLCARKVYSFLFHNTGTEFSRIQLATITGYSHKSGGFKDAISKLNVLNLLRKNGDKVIINEINAEVATEEGKELSVEVWINRLNKCARTIFKTLLDNPEISYERESIANETGYSSISGGFKDAISKLYVLGLIQKEGSEIKLNPELLGI